MQSAIRLKLHSRKYLVNFPDIDLAVMGTTVALLLHYRVGRGGALVETMTFNRRVVGSTPALAAT